MTPVPQTADILPVPVRNEATLGDDVRMPDAKCTPESGGGVIPVVDEVIPDTSMYSKCSSIEIFDLYGVGGEAREEKNSVPFIQNVQLGGPQGEIVRMRGVVDDGAMVSAIDSKAYERVKHRLAGLEKSARVLRMADGRLTPSTGTWTGDVTLGGKTHQGCFEIFDSRGAWALLFGKPLLEKFDAVHEYRPDKLHLRDGESWITLDNQFSSTPILRLTTGVPEHTNFRPGRCAWRREAKIWATVIPNQPRKARDIYRGEGEPPTRQVPAESPIHALEMFNTLPVEVKSNCLHDTPQTLKKTVRFVDVNTRGDSAPPTRRVPGPIIPESEEQLDQPPIFKPVHTQPITSFGEARKSVEERTAWRRSLSPADARKMVEEKRERRILRRKQCCGRRREWKNVLKRANAVGDGSSPTREVPPHLTANDPLLHVDPRFRSGALPDGKRAREDDWSNIFILDDAAGPGGAHPGAEQPVLVNSIDPSILTRKTDPFLPARVEAILANVQVGGDLSPTERSQVDEVLRSFADCFALSMSEVITVEGAEHKLNIPNRANAKFRTNPHQRPLSTPQRIYLNDAIDKMLQADIIAPIDHRDVKCCGATTLAKKIVDHAQKRKAAFDKNILAKAPREVILKSGWLVQIYRSDLDYTFRTERKTEPKWSAPRRVVSRNRNSYKLETLEGLPIKGWFSSRRLRRFIPRTGTSLAEAQQAIEEEWAWRVMKTPKMMSFLMLRMAGTKFEDATRTLLPRGVGRCSGIFGQPERGSEEASSRVPRTISVVIAAQTAGIHLLHTTSSRLLLGSQVRFTVSSVATTDRVYVNTNAPSSAVICGVQQGSGKSHTVSCLLECALIPDSRIGKLPEPLSALVCVRFTLMSETRVAPARQHSSRRLPLIFSTFLSLRSPFFVRTPSNFNRRRRAYASLPHVRVEPLYLSEKDLSADRMLALMGCDNLETMPLYMHTALMIIRNIGFDAFKYSEFKRRLDVERLDGKQKAMITLRLNLLDAFIQQGARQIQSYFSAGGLVLVDLTDPFLDGVTAGVLFDIVLGTFTQWQMVCGKLVVLDEAHKYLVNSNSARLTQSIGNIIRLQRHLGIRVIIATQEPTVVPPTILDLASTIICHRFSSPAWCSHLSRHVSAGNASESAGWLDQVMTLPTGHALVFSPAAMITADENGGGVMGRACLKMKVRCRLTLDGGASLLAVGH
ncbi:p-loop containing nucleoside triphosphate hydrolase protein [Mycena sanguinolenta]|uniref:p-loop containing nucleoside triphosphate hydrolase protein n=1 Tax=Mycena sanguinolenta TaxID=230812 RepID=A0A8H6Z8V8_9AGAR|nr:p-loop containing nucleoside triphosphate hydrolase protein [Mycena sanguinolenta]